ncbi:cyclin-K-like [Belonocnema kinseyi]|uniref:cyclin-K-like n=1 Tax=Belonocnema kinseyi TaxID=2817044 RepID=UPI00143DD633|nr:cyclin-K-like [Belonocnema kinseyi]
MASWVFCDLEDMRSTPSCKDGISVETESRYRSDGVKFIKDLAGELKLGYRTTATAIFFFHRAFMSLSFKEYPRYITACSCLFIAGKSEETPKRSSAFMKAVQSLRSREKYKFIGDISAEDMVSFECVVMFTINFEFQVRHPYKYIVKYAKILAGDKTLLQQVVQTAWIFVNDSLHTPLCIQWEPEVIAIALLHLSAKMNKFVVVDWKGRNKQKQKKKWWDLFVEGLDEAVLDNIGHQVLDLYNTNPKSSSFLDSTASISANGEVESRSRDAELVTSFSSNVVDILGLPVDFSVPPPISAKPPLSVKPTIPTQTRLSGHQLPVPVHSPFSLHSLNSPASVSSKDGFELEPSDAASSVTTFSSNISQISGIQVDFSVPPPLSVQQQIPTQTKLHRHELPVSVHPFSLNPFASPASISSKDGFELEACDTASLTTSFSSNISQIFGIQVDFSVPPPPSSVNPPITATTTLPGHQHPVSVESPFSVPPPNFKSYPSFGHSRFNAPPNVQFHNPPKTAMPFNNFPPTCCSPFAYQPMAYPSV